MKSTTEVTREIRRIVQERIDAGAIVLVEWMTTEILSQKSEIEGADADFYLACGADFVKKCVKRVVGEYEPKEQTGAQLIMPGFDHLQKAYSVVRGGQIVLVPVTMLTDEEVEGRALELEAMAKGCLSHAKEMRAFVIARNQAAA